MSATQAENKQTTNHSPGTWWWQEARFPAPTWQSLRQGLCVSKEETEATRGFTPYPEHPSFCPILLLPGPSPVLSSTWGLSFPT